MSNYNKSYNSTREMLQRDRIFRENLEKIDAMNAKSKASGKHNAATFGINELADLTEEEMSKRLGLKNLPKAPPTKLYHGPRHGLGVVDAVTVDHVADGHMTPVKNQGGCGSCWAFTANTTLEGVISAKTGKAPYHISEQQMVDCTLRNNQHNMDMFDYDYGQGGCNGGWMFGGWHFQRAQGAMLEEDYPYTSGRTGTESKCVHDWDKTVGDRPRDWGILNSTLDDVKALVKKMPLSLAIEAGAPFSFYKSGVVSVEDGCGTNINHGVVLVGYTEKEAEPEPEPEPEPEVNCSVFTWWHECEDKKEDRRMLKKDANGYENYWKI